MGPTEFQRVLRNLESVYRRMDRRELTGRNADATDATIDAHYRRLSDAIRRDAATTLAPLCSWLDDNPKVGARWNRVERRYYGLPL